MRSMYRITRAAAVILVSLTAISAQAASDNGNNGNHYGQIKQEEKRTVSVPEPAVLALLGVGLGALGVGAYLRRRKHD